MVFCYQTDRAGKRVDGLEKLYGSQLIWKIDNYAAKLEEAKAGKKPTIFSPPFLTSRHGYKLAMSCCLYGDGKGKALSLMHTCVYNILIMYVYRVKRMHLTSILCYAKRIQAAVAIHCLRTQMLFSENESILGLIRFVSYVKPKMKFVVVW